MLRRFVILAVLVALASPAVAQGQSTTNVSVPKYSVIPVTATSQLNSATASAGDSFTAVSSGVAGCAIPEGTTFVGCVTRVIRASGRTTGRIAVRFDRMQLPDGTCVGIDGVLAILDTGPNCPSSCPQCPSVSREWQDAHNEFIAGPNCTVSVGVLCRGNVIVGSQTLSLSSICGPNTMVKAPGGQDVVVACGTPFGIMLRQAACVPQACVVCPPAQGAGPSTMISFGAGQPFMMNQCLMVPVTAVMNATGIKYSLDTNTNVISFSTSLGQVTHRIGTDKITVNGQEKQLCGYSGILCGVIYIPSDAICLAGGTNVTWDADRSTLRIQ